jgi:hypothetical protein
MADHRRHARTASAPQPDWPLIQQQATQTFPDTTLVSKQALTLAAPQERLERHEPVEAPGASTSPSTSPYRHSLAGGHAPRAAPRGTPGPSSITRNRWIRGFSRILPARLMAPFVRCRIRAPETAPDQADLAALPGLTESGRGTPVIDRTYPLAQVPTPSAVSGGDTPGERSSSPRKARPAHGCPVHSRPPEPASCCPPLPSGFR